ncbi:hypothetical protein FOCC_FOCC008358, partial [Frankliniella occidentalis]
MDAAGASSIRNSLNLSPEQSSTPNPESSLPAGVPDKEENCTPPKCLDNDATQLKWKIPADIKNIKFCTTVCFN